MLSLEDCKKHLKATRNDDEILRIREELYCLADIYLENCRKGKENEEKQSPDK